MELFVTLHYDYTSIVQVPSCCGGGPPGPQAAAGLVGPNVAEGEVGNPGMNALPPGLQGR